MKRYDLLIAALLALMLVAGCNSEQPAPTAPPPPTAVAKPPAQAVAPPALEAAQPPDELKYVYAAQGRRDPFVPITGKRVASFSDNPLESFDLLQFQLKGLIVGMGDSLTWGARPQQAPRHAGRAAGRRGGGVEGVLSMDAFEGSRAIRTRPSSHCPAEVARCVNACCSSSCALSS